MPNATLGLDESTGFLTPPLGKQTCWSFCSEYYQLCILLINLLAAMV